MGKRDGRQKGAQTHAEGQHGNKAHARLVEQLHEGRPHPDGMRAEGEDQPPVEGKHRLREGRKQFDEAAFNSEKNRATKEVDRGNLDEDDPGVRDRTNGRR